MTRTTQIPHTTLVHTLAVVLAVLLLPPTLQAGTMQGASPAQRAKPNPHSVDSATYVQLLDSLIIPGLAKYHIPGMVIAIVQGNKVVLAKGYGFADVERKIPFDPDSTVMRIASVSKIITGTAVLQLAERGVLDMHRDVNAYLTRFKIESAPEKPITLHHLLTHTAGFDEVSIGKSAWTQETQTPLGDFLAAFLPRRICPPGEVYMYSNYSNALAGFVVEEATHEDYAAYARRSIFEPLGMGRSDYRLRPDLQPLLAQGYAHAGPGFEKTPFDFINDYPGGQMLSTAGDMAKFIIAHLQLGRYGETRILSEESATAMHSVQFTHHAKLERAVGYSFSILPARSQTMLMHDGGYPGVGSRLCLVPESGVGFFLACNIMDGSLLDRVSRMILDSIIPEAPTDTTTYSLAVIPPHDKNIEEFAGTYRHSRYVHSDVTKVGTLIGMSGPEMEIGQTPEGMILMARFSGAPRRMVQVEPGLFRSIDDRYLCAFRRNASGEVTHLFTDGTNSFEKLSWYETATFQRGLLVVCLLYFVVVSIVIPAVQRIRKKQKPSGLDVDPVRWFARKTASTFLLYFLALGIVMGAIIPSAELMIGFAHGMHWGAYVAQTIGLIGILLLSGLIGSIFWQSIGKRDANRSAPSLGLGLMTAVVGVGFVWFLWTWNLVGFKF